MKLKQKLPPFNILSRKKTLHYGVNTVTIIFNRDKNFKNYLQPELEA